MDDFQAQSESFTETVMDVGKTENDNNELPRVKRSECEGINLCYYD